LEAQVWPSPSLIPLREETALKFFWPATAALLTALLQVSGWLLPLERLVVDTLQRTLPARPATQVAVVLIDEEALRQVGPWPWSRTQLAELVEQLRSAGAQGLALDLLLPEKREGDERLGKALSQVPSVLAVGLDDDGNLLLPGPALGTGPRGHVSFELDGDGVVRRFRSTRQVGERSLPALSIAAARLRNSTLPIPVDLTLRPAWRRRPIETLRASAVLAGQGANTVRGRIVFIGASAAGIGDHWITPASRRGSPDPGVLVEAACTEAILTGDLQRPASPLLNAGLALLLGGLGALFLEASGIFLALLSLAPFVMAAVFLPSFRLELSPVAVMVSVAAPGALALIRAGRRTQRGLKEARKRIQALEALREAMPNQREAEARRVLAHELKTPLTSMRGLAQLLARFDLTAQERDRVAGLVVAESTRLAQMVDSLLDLERLTFRNLDREALPVNLSELIRERMDLLRMGSDRTWQVELEPDVRILGDRTLLARVVENLASNAIKFSPAGTPVRVGLRSLGGDAVLEVEDRGPGIAEQERSAIFGRFHRGSAQSLAPGLGLGLALVAEVAAWHRGRVEVDGGSAGGSLFRVRLPLAPERSA
jgi:signal transduction histidine kinase